MRMGQSEKATFSSSQTPSPWRLFLEPRPSHPTSFDTAFAAAKVHSVARAMIMQAKISPHSVPKTCIHISSSFVHLSFLISSGQRLLHPVSVQYLAQWGSNPCWWLAVNTILILIVNIRLTSSHRTESKYWMSFCSKGPDPERSQTIGLCQQMLSESKHVLQNTPVIFYLKEHVGPLRSYLDHRFTVSHSSAFKHTRRPLALYLSDLKGENALIRASKEWQKWYEPRKRDFY